MSMRIIQYVQSVSLLLLLRRRDRARVPVLYPAQCRSPVQMSVSVGYYVYFRDLRDHSRFAALAVHSNTSVGLSALRKCVKQHVW